MPFASDRWGVCGDSMIKLHMLSQIPSSFLCLQLSVCAAAPRILTSFFLSHVKILFCTVEIESIEYQDLAPRDCLWIRVPHWGPCDPPLSSHQTFRHEVELRQCVFCTGPLWSWSSDRPRNFGLQGSEYKYSASSILLPLLQDVPSLIPENCVRVQAILCLPDYLWNPLTREWKISQTVVRISIAIPLFILVLDFQGFLLQSPAQILNLMMSSMQLCFQMLEMPLISTIPVVAMWETNCFQNWQITLERQEVRNCPIFGQSWLLTDDPFIGVSVFWAKQMKQ